MTTPFEMIVSKDLDRNQSPLDAFGDPSTQGVADLWAEARPDRPVCR